MIFQFLIPKIALTPRKFLISHHYIVFMLTHTIHSFMMIIVYIKPFGTVAFKIAVLLNLLHVNELCWYPRNCSQHFQHFITYRSFKYHWHWFQSGMSTNSKRVACSCWWKSKWKWVEVIEIFLNVGVSLNTTWPFTSYCQVLVSMK